MKTTLIFLLSIAVTSCGSIDFKTKRTEPFVKDVKHSARSGDVIRKRVLVLPFINLSPYPSKIAAKIARDSLIRALHATGEVVFVRISDFADDLDKYKVGDSYNLKGIAAVAWKMGVHGVIEGRIKEIRSRKIGDTIGVLRKVKAQVKAHVELKMVSTKSGNYLVKESRTSEIEEEVTRVAERARNDRGLKDNPVLVQAVLRSAIKEMVAPVVVSLRKLTWEGRIALVQGDKVYLNAGRASGLQVGDILRIVDSQKEIYDPETGEFIGDVRGRMKGTVEVLSYFGKDGAVSFVHSGSGFKENDIAEFY